MSFDHVSEVRPDGSWPELDLGIERPELEQRNHVVIFAEERLSYLQVVTPAVVVQTIGLLLLTVVAAGAFA